VNEGVNVHPMRPKFVLRGSRFSPMGLLKFYKLPSVKNESLLIKFQNYNAKYFCIKRFIKKEMHKEVSSPFQFKSYKLKTFESITKVLVSE
jgi:hypothetical protein